MASQAVLKAVTSARFTQTRLLVHMGSGVNGRDVKGQTPLVHALFLRDANVRISFLRLLLRAGAVVSAVDNKKRNVLMWACSVCSSEDVTLLLKYADEELDLNAQNLEGQTALRMAVDANKTDTVKVLLQALFTQKMNSEVADHWGVTPSMRAAVLGHFDCLRILILHLETTTNSSNTRVNIAKINKVLKTMSISGEPEMMHVSPRRVNPEIKTTVAPKLPVLQVISTNGDNSVTSPPAEPSGHNQQTPDALLPVEFFRDPTRCSTPMSLTIRAASSCARSQRSSQVSPIPFDSEDPDLNRSFRFSERGGAMTPEAKSIPVKISVKFQVEDQDRADERKRSVTAPGRRGQTAAAGSALSLPDAGRGFWRVPLTSVSSVMPRATRGSVRDSLPRLFDLYAEQSSYSFRKTAVKPLPKMKMRPRGDSWAKLRDLTLFNSRKISQEDESKSKGKTKRKVGMVKQRDR